MSHFSSEHQKYSMDGVKEKEVFAQRQLPLSVSIRRLLDRYPDGQILKV